MQKIIGGSAAASGVKNNDTLMTPEEMSALVFGNGRAEVYLQLICNPLVNCLLPITSN